MKDVIIFEESNSLLSADFAGLKLHILAAHTDVYQHFSCTIERGHRGANKTPIEQRLCMLHFAAAAEQIRAQLSVSGTVYRKATPESNKLKTKAKGPRNRWGAVK